MRMASPTLRWEQYFHNQFRLQELRQLAKLTPRRQSRAMLECFVPGIQRISSTEQDLRYLGTQRTSWNVLLQLLAGFATSKVLSKFFVYKIAQSLPFLNNMIIVYCCF